MDEDHLMSKPVPTLPVIRAQYRALWNSATLTTYGKKKTPARPGADLGARLIIAGKARYQAVSAKTPNRIPWFFIGLLHYRESRCDFSTYLGNGQALDRVTTIKPHGRGPFRGADAFDRGCLDALSGSGGQSVNLFKVTDWSLESILFHQEGYNGWGYYQYRPIKSPYLWSGTNHYTQGKYASDGKYDPALVDEQMGVVPILKALAEKDASVNAALNGQRPSTSEPVVAQADTKETFMTDPVAPAVVQAPVEPWFKSKIIWTQVIAAVATMLTMVGFDMDADTQKTVVSVIVFVAGLVSTGFRIFSVSVTPTAVSKARREAALK